MNEDRRKNLRTQGKYGDGKGQKSREKKQRSSHETANESTEIRLPKRNSDSYRSGTNADKSISPIKYEKDSVYTFQQYEKTVRPEEIREKGTVILSKTDNGESSVMFEPDFFSEEEGDDYFNLILKNVNFDERNIVIHGIEYPQPRLVAWFGPFEYSYSGTTLEPAEMPGVVLEIKDKVEKYLASNDIAVTFNSVLINLYRDGKDSVSWHSDDEIMLGITPTIASVSLGETRKFEMRPKIRNYDSTSPSDETCKYLIHLTHGSLVVMTGCMQEDWQHRVPKEYHDRDTRINLTFRRVYPLEESPGYVPVKGNYRETAKKSWGHNSLSTSSKYGYKVDEEHFPSLQKDTISAKSNMVDNSDKKNWDDETFDNERKVESSAVQKKTCHAFNKKSEDFIPESDRKSNFNVENNCDNERNPLNHKTATKKLWCDDYDSSVNGFQENNIVMEERCEVKGNKSVNNSSASEIEGNKFYEKIDLMKSYNNESNSRVNHPQQNVLNQEEISAISYIKTNSYRNVIQENDINSEEPQKMCHDPKTNSWIDSVEEKDFDVTKTANVFPSASQEKDLGNKKSLSASHHVENSSWMNSAKEYNLGVRQPTKVMLNVDAKVFVPSTIKSNEVSQYSELNLEGLLDCDINLLQGKNLQDHAHCLKLQIESRFHEINRFDRKEVEFLLEITDGTQTDKNQRLISQQICRIVQNSLLSLPSNAVSPFDRSSRHRGYENQNCYSDKGKRYNNPGRSSKFNRNKY